MTASGPVDVLTDVAKAGQTSPVPGEKILRATTYAVALDWTALTPGTAMDAILQLDVAENFSTFRPDGRHAEALTTVLDQVVAWSAALAPLRRPATVAA